MSFLGGRIMASLIPKNVFLGAGDGMTHPYKWFYTKKIITFYMMSDEVKLYIKIIENDEI